jgi:hypothetical protein
LLFYDETDRFVRHSEGDRIQALCPGARLVKTSAYSHQKILAAPELAQAVGEFLKKRVAEPQQGGASLLQSPLSRGMSCALGPDLTDDT